jgi:hypothetical protein
VAGNVAAALNRRLQRSLHGQLRREVVAELIQIECLLLL